MNYNEKTIKSFYSLSAKITGFNHYELLATGVGDEYFNFFVNSSMQPLFLQLLEEWEKNNSNYEVEGNRKNIFENLKYLDIVQKLVMLWYTGSWYEDFNIYKVISSESYVQGLMWKAIGAHPLGAKPQGYGAWALPPEKI